MKELISHLLKQVAAILEYVIAFMLAIGIILLCLVWYVHFSIFRI